MALSGINQELPVKTTTPISTDVVRCILKAFTWLTKKTSVPKSLMEPITTSSLIGSTLPPPKMYGVGANLRGVVTLRKVVRIKTEAVNPQENVH